MSLLACALASVSGHAARHGGQDLVAKVTTSPTPSPPLPGLGTPSHPAQNPYNISDG